MKRHMINIEQLRFPSGIAAAETLRALHAKSSRGLRAAKALGLAGLIAAIDKVWAEGEHSGDADQPFQAIPITDSDRSRSVWRGVREGAVGCIS
jgi:uncharacterized oligopeptide transporter (OPT) family protein